MRASYVPVITARKWLSPTCRFVNVLLFNFLWKRKTRQESSTSDFVVCMEVSAWVPAVSEHFKDRNTNIADQLRCGRPRTAATSKKVDEFIRRDRRITVRETAAQLGVGHHAVREMMDNGISEKLFPLGSPFLTVQKNTKRLWSALPYTLQSGFGPLRLPLVRTLERSPERSPLRGWRGSPGSRAKLCEELERTSTAEAFLRFCNTGRNT
jgi:hypothetical protein